MWHTSNKLCNSNNEWDKHASNKLDNLISKSFDGSALMCWSKYLVVHQFMQVFPAQVLLSSYL